MTVHATCIHQSVVSSPTSPFQLSDHVPEEEEHQHQHDDCHQHQHHEYHSHDSHQHCSHDQWAHYLPHAHSFHERLHSDRRSLIIACFMLLSVFSLQLIAGYLANSSVLRVEALHSALDGTTTVLSLIAVIVAARQPNNQMPYGYARAEVLAALISLLALALMCIKLAMGACERLWHYFHSTLTQNHVHGKIIFIAQAFALCSNLIIAFIVTRNDKSLNIRALRAHVIADSMENLLVLIAGIIMWTKPHLAIIDAILTPIIVALIIYVNYSMVIETISILMQATPNWINVNDLKDEIMKMNHVIAISKLQVWVLTAEQIVGTCTLIVQETTDFNDVEKIRRQVENLLVKLGVTDTTVQVCGNEDRLAASDESDDGWSRRQIGDLEYDPISTDDAV